MGEFNSDTVIPTLRLLVGILKDRGIEYRFLGSVVIAAINGKLHRDLADLDLIIDDGGKQILYTELKKLGYTKASGMFRFARKYLFLEQLKHPSLFSIGYFYGKFQPDGSFVMGNKQNNLRTDWLYHQSMAILGEPVEPHFDSTSTPLR